MAARDYTSRRRSIVTAIAGILADIDGTGSFRTTLVNISERLRFWDEIQEFPAVDVNAGSETRVYQGAGFADRYLTMTIRCYVQQEDATLALEALLEDVETVLAENGRLAYLDSTGATQYTRDIKVVGIDTDEGVLEPLGVGELLLEVSY